MEIWLKCDKKAIQLPILPPSFAVNLQNGHQTVNVQTKGDVSILGKKGLRSIDISSFFPDQDYPFAAYPKDREAYDYIKELLKWQEKPVRLTITDTNINMETSIQSFSYGEPDGSGDIEYTLSLQEYRKPTYSKPEVEENLQEEKLPGKEEPPKRPVKEPQKTYVVKSGDNLWNLAKQFYGSGSQQSKLYNANKTVIEAAAKKHGKVSSSNKGVPGWWIYPGTKLVIPA